MDQRAEYSSRRTKSRLFKQCEHSSCEIWLIERRVLSRVHAEQGADHTANNEGSESTSFRTLLHALTVPRSLGQASRVLHSA